MKDTTDNNNKIARKTTIEKILFFLKLSISKHFKTTKNKQKNEYDFYLKNFKAKK